jgi:hypothetical protein
MRKLVLTLALALIAGFAISQNAPQQRQRGPGGGGDGRGGNPINRALDTDRDGVISTAEINNAARALLALDANKDGKLSSTELGRDNQNRGGQDRARRPTNPTDDNRDNGQGRRPRGGGSRGGQTRGIMMPTPAFRTEVPERSFDHILGRPTDSSVTVSVAAYQALEFYIEHGSSSGQYPGRIAVGSLAAGQTKEVDISSLRANTRYFYRLRHRASNGDYTTSPEYTFHTQRAPGSPFVFTVQADSHLDFGIVPEKYEQTLANALADKTDFHIELGDTFMVDKYTDYRRADKQYLAQRYYFSRLCHSAPLFFVLGNHDGEFGHRDTGGRDNMAVWSANMRKTYFPNPSPNDFYTGNQDRHRELGQLEDYYAWEWGDALFVALDPFWYSTNRRGGQWAKTLGERQYNWLKRSLENSDAQFKFIFLHYLVGGLNNETRGAKSIAHLYEWGGHNTEGVNEWKQQRPGWEMPIHDLLVKHNVSVVFHGHDHLYAREELDGIVYQEVPQPGHRRFGNTRSASEYGYRDGVILSSSGHVRVTVSAAKAVVDYVYSFLPNEERNGLKNGQVADSYTITP